MLYFDFLNPHVIYLFFLFLSVFTVYAIFTYIDFITKHKKKIYLVASILLIWTQLARYLGVLFKDGFDPLEHLPFYMCRISAVVLLAYTLTKSKYLKSFLFYWGALGIAGILYPNGPIENVANLSETFYVDHFLLTMIPFFLVVYEGYRPSKRDLVIITGVMAVILYSFIPINNYFGSDYFYLLDQSIFGVLFPGASSYVFATVHYLVAGMFFFLYYIMFRNTNFSTKKVQLWE